MNLNDLYEMRDPRDAYQRDIANSTSGFGKDSKAYRADGGANDERHDLDPSEWYIVKDGKMFKATVYPNQEQQATARGYSRTRDEAKTKADQQGMAEGWKGALAGGLAGAALGSVAPGFGTLAGAAAGAYAGHKMGDEGFKDPDAEYKKAQKLKQQQNKEVAEGHTEVKDKQGKVVSWKDDSEWHRDEKNKQGQPKDPRGVVTHLSDVARRKTAKQQGMAEGAEFGANYAEQLAQKVFNVRPKLASDDDILNIGYKIAVQDLMSQVRANHLFARDQDFPSDFVTAYSYLQKQGMTEAEVDSDGHSVDHADSGEYDYEGDQAKDQLNTIVRAAQRLNGMLDDNENMPEWVQMKITNAADYIDTAADYIESNQEPELVEGDRVGNMDADKFDAAMARLKQLAGAGPMKTVYDPAKRVYRNVPTAVQPKK